MQRQTFQTKEILCHFGVGSKQSKLNTNGSNLQKNQHLCAGSIVCLQIQIYKEMSCIT
uniref:Uncharacterized protein n=1 Tax=Rhizophora mucronata TaxID=61149 RepID=A0A2P2MZJ9_RHIMU